MKCKDLAPKRATLDWGSETAAYEGGSSAAVGRAKRQPVYGGGYPYPGG